MVSWFQDRKDIVEGSGAGKLLTSWQPQNREAERGVRERGTPFQVTPH